MSIILDEPCAQLSFLQNEFQERLSKKPYCADDLGYGLYIRDKPTALTKKFIQHSSPITLSWLCFDLDYPCVLETTFKEKVLPLPNFIVINPKNHHSHLLYGIEEKIYLSDNARLDPIRYAHAVSYALREELKADAGYTGLIVKNPMNVNWNTIELTKELWSLNGLAEYLKLPKTMPKRENLIGLGRNCTLFELGRKYAYGEVLKQKIIGNKESFYQIVLHFMEQQNKDFPEPLLYNEYKAIAKSITNWTWKHYGDKTSGQWKSYVKRTHSVEIQAFRGRLGGLANTKEQQAIKGLKNTKEQQALKGLANTSEQQALKGKIGGKNNTKEQQSLKGSSNTSEKQKIKALKSAKIRFEGSNEQLKPWEKMGISRRSYYYKKIKN